MTYPIPRNGHQLKTYNNIQYNNNYISGNVKEKVYGLNQPEGMVKNNHRVWLKTTRGYGRKQPEGMVENDHYNNTVNNTFNNTTTTTIGGGVEENIYIGVELKS